MIMFVSNYAEGAQRSILLICRSMPLKSRLCCSQTGIISNAQHLLSIIQVPFE